MPNPCSNKKKVRGWKRRLRQLERLRQAHLHLDVESLRAAEYDYVKIWLDPWSRLVRRNPPFWYRRRILAAFIDIYESWRRTLEASGEPYYLELWVFHPDFHGTQVVAAMGDRLQFYDNVFEPAEHAPRPPALYDDPAYDLGRFRWRPGTEIFVRLASVDVAGPEDEARLLREADRVQKSAYTGDTMYIFDMGSVWQGSLADHPST